MVFTLPRKQPPTINFVNQPSAALWLAVVLLIISIINLACLWQNWWPDGQMLLFIIFFVIHGWLAGRWLFKQQGLFSQLIFGCLVILGLISIVGSAFYYAWLWNSLAMNITLCLIVLLAWPGLLTLNNLEIKKVAWFKNVSYKKIFLELILMAVWVMLISRVWQILLGSQTWEPIRSPWNILPTAIWWWFIGAVLVLVLMSLWFKNAFLTLFWAGQAITALGLTIIMYPLGYGFDPFIHQATEKLLAAFGTFSPAPLYYLGQYSSVTFLHHFSTLALVDIDRYLVPILAAVILPIITFVTLRKNFKTNLPALLITSGAVLAIPLGVFIMTTPYNLALLYAALTIAASLFYLEQRLSVIPTVIFALAATATHALVGIPIIIFVVLMIIWRIYQNKEQRAGMWFWLAALISPLGLPLAMVVNGLRNNSTALIDFKHFNLTQAWQTLGSPLLPKWITYFDFSDLAYFYSYNLGFIILILIILGIIFTLCRARLHRLAIYLIGAISTLLSAILMAGLLNFNFLITYERQDFPQRVLIVSLIIAWPLLLIAMYRLAKKLYEANWLGQLIIMILMTTAITAGWFLTYPNFDQYRKDRGYNTSWVDFEVVKKINQDAANKPYIVLANQSVAAAAVATYGFNHNFNGHYFYPIPTGGPLYQLYLEIVYGTPNVGTISKARELTGVPLVYLVINDYWDSSDRLIREARTTTPNNIIVGQNRAVIFKYE